MSTDYKIIESLNDLPEGVTFPKGSVAVDGEMMGLNFHRDRLCLVQLADGLGNVWLVKFDGTDYSAPRLKKLLTDSKVTKIFHFGRLDLTYFIKHFNVLTTPVYCTKIASKLCRTYTSSHGFKSLVADLLDIQISKEQQCSYWGAKTLSEDQKHYAATDVIYLHQMKDILDERLADVKRTELAQACFDFLPTRAKIDFEGWEDVDIFAH